MRKLLLLSLLTVAVAFPLRADNHGRSQSYISFDDGGTTIRQGDDGKEVEARLNFPVYPGDEIITNRRGRSEIRLSDGNVIALDHSTDVLIKSARDSYDGDANLTVVEVHYGHVMVERDDDGSDPIRIDTDNGSYATTEAAIYALETDRGRDRIAVFDGSLEVRTPQRTTRIRSGEEGHVDDQGLYDVVSSTRGGADDFERWFIRRAQLYRGSSSRYLDSSLAYSDRDLDSYGSWVYVNDYSSWCWRPRVEVGWRPYFHGSWHYGRGSLVWISYEPWGWVPYHYGRWAYDPFYGWLWMPGYAYSPAWVYWLYGPGYVGWAPAGWYDCYRPYYSWAYRPYSHYGYWGWNGGFYGRVHLRDIDLRPWTFVHPNSIVSGRVDRAAMNVDLIRNRLARDPNAGLATVSNAPARFTRSEMRDPAAAVGVIARRGLGSGTGNRNSGSVADMTSFFRRDPDVSGAVRGVITRSHPGVQPGSILGGPRGAPSGVPTPGATGTLEGRVPRDGGGNRHNAPTPGSGGIIGRGTGTMPGTAGDPRTVQGAVDRGNWRNGGTTGSTGTVNRGDRSNAPADRGFNRDRGTTPPPDRGTINRGEGNNPPSDRGSWRNRDTGSSRDNGGSINRDNGNRNSTPPPERRSNDRNNASYDRSWRNAQPSRGEYTPRYDNGNSGRDVPRRIIDGIGGARIYSGDRPSSRGGDTPRYTPPPRNYTPSPRSYSPPPSHSSGSSNGGSHSNGGSSRGSSGGHVHRGN